MKIALIVNPAASSVTARTRIVIQKALSADHDLTTIETTRKHHATRLAHQLERDGIEVIIPLGGDGTVNEVANGILNTSTAVAPLPGGSTNVFARALGYPNDSVEATGVLLEALAAKNIIAASVGEANGRAFLFHVGIGFDAAVVHRVERRGPLKRYLGHPWFLASAISTWMARSEVVPFAATRETGDTIAQAQMAVALNMNPYTFFGSQPLDLAPEATLDSKLSLVALESVALGRLHAAGKAALFSKGGLPTGKGVTHWDEVDRVTITADAPVPYQLDGEPLDPVTEIVLEHRPEALRVVVPMDHAGA